MRTRNGNFIGGLMGDDTNPYGSVSQDPSTVPIGDDMPETRQPGVLPQKAGLPGDTGQSSGVPGFTDQLKAKAIVDTSGQTPEQRKAQELATKNQRALDEAGAKADQDYLNSHGGQWGDHKQYQPGVDPSSTDYGGKLVGGSDFDEQNGTDSGTGDSTDNGATPPPPGDFSRLAGYNKDKFDANKDDAKYKMGHVLSNFDPTKGITPEVIAALNQLGYGTFSGSGDKLSLSGLTDAGRKAGLTGDYAGADFIQGLHSGNGKWGYADPVAEGASGGGSGSNANGFDQGGGYEGSAGYGATGETTKVSDDLKSLLQRYYAQGTPGIQLFTGTGIGGRS